MKQLKVLLRRESDGQVYSEVVDAAERLSPLFVVGQYSGVVIDRTRGRGMDVTSVRKRAEHLAKLIGAELDEDLTWPCIASRRLACKCPACIQAGRA